MKMNSEGKPLIGSNARCLGVRVGAAEDDDINPKDDGTVEPNETEGMSVAPGWRLLMHWRIPRRLNGHGVAEATGPDSNYCWKMGTGEFVDGALTSQLRLKVTSVSHGAVQPVKRVQLSEYVTALEATQPQWIIDES
jgi:hypothetical protein